MTRALVIGAGPAGLMAADMLSRAGHSVLVADAMPSPARKFLMAGKSGLNLTKTEPFDQFCKAFGPSLPRLRPMLSAFGPEEVCAWAGALGQPLFTGSTGRVFPTAMKASPLLRAWLENLSDQDVTIKTRWRWIGWDGRACVLRTQEGTERLTPDATILACGGASWSRLGSDGAWAAYLPEKVAPFRPANMGFRLEWSTHMRRHFGSAIKGIALYAGAQTSRGEIVISARGLEGGGLYALSSALRDGAALTLDLAPDLGATEVRARLTRPRGKNSLSNHLRKTLRLDPAKIALLTEFARPLPDDLAPLIKSLPVPHLGPRPIDEAISTAGGLRFDTLDEGLMLLDRPGTFACGEMLDWEAPTGGYLLTACLATGRWAGLSAAHYLSGASGNP
ncbi:TIGR03862 family flavoprotein [Roseovarius sp. SCSIO 43702]|uniref:TIGR03862 family flavoprotein n=1 Tax=Roseovarius sp. SCSIO 43702 TaxID=2823043 RepID=UPI001C730E1C|nr:TIGR03862 family flavoprotein [Roseovarius sp. SCSIO 43702]QYX56167.1 TIGR03862 family flavoprotein [Roseovarius sp. SCSIO 43702]